MEWAAAQVTILAEPQDCSELASATQHLLFPSGD
jgi:hypothetical protein